MLNNNVFRQSLGNGLVSKKKTSLAQREGVLHHFDSAVCLSGIEILLEMLEGLP